MDNHPIFLLGIEEILKNCIKSADLLYHEKIRKSEIVATEKADYYLGSIRDFTFEFDTIWMRKSQFCKMFGCMTAYVSDIYRTGYSRSKHALLSVYL